MLRLPRAGSFAIGAALMVSACSDGANGGRDDLAAQAGTTTLPPERLAGWIARVPSRLPTRRDAESISLVWVDYSLLAQAVERGRPLTDSATAASALQPDRVLLTLRAWHDTLTVHRPRVESRVADSLYRSDSLRLFQHILIQVDDARDARAVAAARGRVDSLFARVRDGEDFAALARQHSQDGSAAGGGYLPVARLGQLPPEFQRSAWPLAPGRLTGVPSRLGLHIVRRPPLAEVRDRFLAWADSAAARVADSLHADSLRGVRRFTITRDAVPVLRAYFDDPATRARATSPLATWEAGELPLERVALWIDLLPPASYADLRGGSDLALEGFVRDIGLQYLLLEQAEAAGIEVTSTQWRGLQDGYRRALREALALLGLSDTLSALPPGEAEGRVTALIEGLTAERVRWRPLPSALGALLRAETGYRLHGAGLTRAAELALEVRGQAP